MTREEEARDARLFDVRTVERNIKRGLITRKEYERFLKALPDAAGNVTTDEPDTTPPEPMPATQPQG